MPCECDNPRNELRSQAAERKQKWVAWERTERDSIMDTGGQIPAIVVLGQSAPGRGSGGAFGCGRSKLLPFFVV